MFKTCTLHNFFSLDRNLNRRVSPTHVTQGVVDAINERKKAKQNANEDGLCEALGWLIQNGFRFLFKITRGETFLVIMESHACIHACAYMSTLNQSAFHLESCSEDFQFQIKF